MICKVTVQRRDRCRLTFGDISNRISPAFLGAQVVGVGVGSGTAAGRVATVLGANKLC